MINHEESLISILESVGLRHNEVLVYLDLIKSGSSTVIEISKRTRIHRPNVYDSISKLKERGLVLEGIKNNKRIFYSGEPEDLVHILKEQENNLRRIITNLREVKKRSHEENKLMIAEGLHSIKNTLWNLLDIRLPISIYGTPKVAYDLLGGFTEEFNKERIKRKIIMRHIYNREAKDRIKNLNKLKFTEARYLPTRFISDTSVNICDDHVIMVFWEKPFSAVVIKNHDIANTYQNYFEMLWKNSRKVI